MLPRYDNLNTYLHVDSSNKYVLQWRPLIDDGLYPMDFTDMITRECDNKGCSRRMVVPYLPT